MTGQGIIPMIIGSKADLLTEETRVSPELTHSWKCYVRVDPSTVKSVQFKLHSSFIKPVIEVFAPPFEITECGWGEFTIQIRIVLFNDEKIHTTHYLSLYSDSYPHVSERYDSAVYRGKQVPIAEMYNYIHPGAERERTRILKAIDYLLEQCERLKRTD